MATAQEILDFWFGELDPEGVPLEDRSELWWGKNPRLDALIRERFEGDVREAGAGLRDGWAADALGALALVICLDQFPRNIYRDTAASFAYDAKARSVALETLSRGVDRKLSPVQRVFLYLPLEHAEDVALQEKSVVLFFELQEDVAEKPKPVFTMYLDYARRHKEIVDRFGRFPHRNKILGRLSTPEETAFLQTPGSSF